MSSSFRLAATLVTAAAASVVAASVTATSARAQLVGRGLVIPVPAAERVSVAADSFRTSTGGSRQFDVYRARDARGPAPIVVFVNGAGAELRRWRSYVEWAQLVTSRGFAGVLYEGPVLNPGRPMSEHLRTSAADLDSLLVTLARRARTHELDSSNIVLWAGSAQTYTGTPVALGGTHRNIRGYVLYCGSGDVSAPRLDVPVFVARAGLDAPSLNHALDSLTARFTVAGVPLTVANYPAGRHGFDIVDSTAMTARIVTQTLNFIEAVIDPALARAIADGVPETRASAAFAAGKWADAERLYGELAELRPQSASVAWRLGLARLETRRYADALTSFARARELGMGGARDIGVPAVRAAIRGGDTERAVDWTLWALGAFPAIRAMFAADPELAPMLEHPRVR